MTSQTRSTRYLQTCLELHAKLGRVFKQGGQKLTRLEEVGRSVAVDGRKLTYSKAKAIVVGELWAGGGWYRFPDKAIIEPALNRHAAELQVWRLRQNPQFLRETLDALLQVFKNIEVVSVLLRFMVPEHCAILSPPVERLLQTRRLGSIQESYESYLADLRQIGTAHGLDRIADVDMALWTLQVGVLDGRLGGIIDERQLKSLGRNSRKDGILQRVRRRNMVEPLASEEHDWSELAEAFRERNVTLAAVLAGVELERRIRVWRDRASVTTDTDDLYAVIDGLETDDDTKAQLHRARKVRNRAVHPHQGNTDIARTDVDELVSAVQLVKAADG